tara:strand:- start:40 stop:1764 length:1725 start_codon:yes stop_codon:yes gene_type:complete
MVQNFRKKLDPNYKKKKRRIDPRDIAPEVGHQQEVDKQQAVQDADMNEEKYLQDPETQDISKPLQIKEMDKIYKKDRIDNLKKDRAIEASDKAHKAGNISDEEHIQNLLNAPNYITPEQLNDAPMKTTDPFGDLLMLAASNYLVRHPGQVGSFALDLAFPDVEGVKFEQWTRLNPQVHMAVKGTQIAAIKGKQYLSKQKEYWSNVIDYLTNPNPNMGIKAINSNQAGGLERISAEGIRVDPLYSTFLESRKIDNTSGSGYSYRKGRPLKNPIYDNLSPKVQNQFTEAGIDSDKAKFFIEEWTREVGANVEGFPFTDRTFEFMKGKLLPKILEDMKGINLSDGLQLDHIAQLKAMTPFYQGRNLKQAEKIRRILIKEGIFGGHNPKNLKYLPTDVHTVKTNFWRDQVGDAGEKFFEGRKMDTYADVEKAAKEMKLFINRSNDIVERVSAQYRVMRKKKISAEELDKILKKVDLNYGTYNLKEVRKLIKEEINVDTLAKSKKGLEDAKAAAEAVEFKEKKTFLPHEIEDVDPADIPKKPRTRKKKSTLEKMAEKEFLKEHERIKKLGGQTELPLDE